MACDCGLIVSLVCFIASCLTLLLGATYIVQRIDDGDFTLHNCDTFLQEDCNARWRGVFALNPCVFFDVWGPFLVGILGCSIHVHSLRLCFLFECLLPCDYIQYMFFMLFTALFANFGYCGLAGLIVGAVSLVAAVMCLVARFMHELGVKKLQTKF